MLLLQIRARASWYSMLQHANLCVLSHEFQECTSADSVALDLTTVAINHPCVVPWVNTKQALNAENQSCRAGDFVMTCAMTVAQATETHQEGQFEPRALLCFNLLTSGTSHLLRATHTAISLLVFPTLPAMYVWGRQR